MGVSSVDYDVSLVHQGDKLVDEIIDGLPGLDHQENLSGSLEGRDEILEARRPVDVLTLAPVRHEVLHLGDRTVEDAHAEALAFHVEDEVLSHDGETDESYI